MAALQDDYLVSSQSKLHSDRSDPVSALQALLFVNIYQCVHAIGTTRNTPLVADRFCYNTDRTIVLLIVVAGVNALTQRNAHLGVLLHADVPTCSEHNIDGFLCLLIAHRVGHVPLAYCYRKNELLWLMRICWSPNSGAARIGRGGSV